MALLLILELGRGGQLELEVAVPGGRVLTCPIAAMRRPIEDGLDAAPDAGGGLGLGVPDGLENLQQVGSRDVLRIIPRLGMGKTSAMGRQAPAGLRSILDADHCSAICYGTHVG
jgi:hypothetical protein